MSRTLFAILIATLGTGCVQKTLTKPRILGSYPPYGAPKAPPYGRRQAVAVPSAPVSPTTRTAVPVVPVVPVQQGIAVPLQQAPVVEQPQIVVPFDASGQTRPPVPPPASGGQLVPSQPQTQPPVDPGRQLGRKGGVLLGSDRAKLSELDLPNESTKGSLKHLRRSRGV